MTSIMDVADVMGEEDVRLLLAARGKWIEANSDAYNMSSKGVTSNDFERWADEVKVLARCLRDLRKSKEQTER